jgi:hypothetical protein
MILDALQILITRYWYLLAALAFGVVFVIMLIRTSVRRKDAQPASRDIWDFLFLWPLLLSRRDGGQVVRRGFSNRELIGWLIVAVIAVLAVVLTRIARG